MRAPATTPISSPAWSSGIIAPPTVFCPTAASARSITPSNTASASPRWAITWISACSASTPGTSMTRRAGRSARAGRSPEPPSAPAMPMGVLTMTMRIARGLLVAALVAALPSGRALAQSPLVEEVQAHFYAGRTADAAAAAAARLAQAPDDGTARFALGAAEFLQAVEHLGQGLHRYGLHGEASVTGMVGLPILRLPVPLNPRPDPLTYEAFGALLVAFVKDLQKAEATLAAVESEAVDLPLDIGLVRLDLNGDGTAS